ncbi:MAG: hypothetical protein H0W72_12925 [Planctomycetes bacterium]|nr:hypothetical protein [Planctomycetota bacterium]
MPVLPRLASLLAGLLLAGGLGAAENAAIAAYKKAMASEDYAAKKSAIGGLAGKGAGDDDTVLPLLVNAIGDRQAGKIAIEALRARTGLALPAKQSGGSGYPGYPSDDSAGSWSAWIAARKAALAQEAKLKKLVEDAEKKEKAAAGEAGDGAEVATDATATGSDEGAAPAVTVAEIPPPSDLGRIDRVTFRTGGSLRCYIMSKHTDPDGNLLSVRVVHPDGGGEETLAADLVARIEEDVE